MRPGDGAPSAANRPGRATTAPMAEMVCVNGSTLAGAVAAATTGLAPPPSAASGSSFLHALMSSAAAQATAAARRGSGDAEFMVCAVRAA